MAYGYIGNEFPHADYYESDLRELIRLYNELTATYDGLKDEIQKMLDYIKDFDANVSEEIQKNIQLVMSIYTQRLIKVEQLVKELEDTVNKLDDEYIKFPDLQKEVDRLTALINDKYFELNRNYLNLVELFHEYKNGLDAYIDAKAEDLEKYIESIVTHLDRLDVTNPINKKFEDINKVLQDIFALIQQSYSLTAKEYDNLKLSAVEYDRMKIKAQDYDTKGFLIFWELRQGLMISPFTGSSVKISTVVNMLTNLHKCTFTAKQYDDIGFTALEFDSWKISAYNYDWFGRKLVLERKPIDAETYDKLKLTAEIYDKKELTAGQYDTYGNALLTLLPTFTPCQCQSCNSDVLFPLPQMPL